MLLVWPTVSSYGHIALGFSTTECLECNGIRTNTATRSIPQNSGGFRTVSATRITPLTSYPEPSYHKLIPTQGVDQPYGSVNIGDAVITSSTMDGNNGKRLNLVIINNGKSILTQIRKDGLGVLVQNGVIMCAVPINSLVRASLASEGVKDGTPQVGDFVNTSATYDIVNGFKLNKTLVNTRSTQLNKIFSDQTAQLKKGDVIMAHVHFSTLYKV
jgi:hypothetical protein